MSASGEGENMDPTNKFKKYEAEYTQYLMAKYFSDKDIHGGKIFENEVKIDDQIVKSSRSSCISSYINPILTLSAEESKARSSGQKNGEGSSSGATKKQKQKAPFIPPNPIIVAVPPRKPRTKVEYY